MNKIPHLVAVTLLALAANSSAAGKAGFVGKADRVVVDKSDRQLVLYRDSELIASYRIALGGTPVGPKRREGDGRTPEGNYILDQKNDRSRYYKTIRISYPNDYDKFIAEQEGHLTGSDIMIHGQKKGFSSLSWITRQWNWTDGSIALSNHDMDEVWAAVDAGTPIEIKP